MTYSMYACVRDAVLLSRGAILSIVRRVGVSVSGSPSVDVVAMMGSSLGCTGTSVSKGKRSECMGKEYTLC